MEVRGPEEALSVLPLAATLSQYRARRLELICKKGTCIQRSAIRPSPCWLQGIDEDPR